MIATFTNRCPVNRVRRTRNRAVLPMVIDR